MRNSLSRRVAAEGLGTALLLSAVTGSGIMGDRLSPDNSAVALLANSLATGAALIALILTCGPVSGAHFNPLVTLSSAIRGKFSWGLAWSYLTVQLLGALLGVMLAHVMFAEPRLLAPSAHVRSGAAQWLSEGIATFGLLTVIASCGRRSTERAAVAVGLYIAAAYWFTASTSFANPAATIARSFTPTFVGIRPVDAPAFVIAQTMGAAASFWVSGWLFPEDAGSLQEME